jgi:DNA-binding response OmpR family regulator
MVYRPNVAGQGGGAGTILVVEDDRPTRELLGTILREERLPYHLTATGHEAMEFAHRATPAMVVLDLHLPSLQGEAVATALRIEHGRSLPILAISASYEHAAAERIGAFSYVQKPFEIEEFIRQVRYGLDLAQRSKQLRERSAEARANLQRTMLRQRQAFDRFSAGLNDDLATEPAATAQ